MLVSIVPHFSNRWYLLCLEISDTHWLSGCVCLEALHSDCFCCMRYLLCLEMLHSHWMSALLLHKIAAILVSPHFDWLSGLQWFGEEGGLHCSNGLKVLKYYQLICNKAIWRDLFEKKYHSRLNFGGDPNSRLEIKKFPVDMPFLGWGGGVLKRSTHIHTEDRLCKSYSAKARLNSNLLRPKQTIQTIRLKLCHTVRSSTTAEANLTDVETMLR